MNKIQNLKTYCGLDVGKFLCAFLILFYHYFSEHGSLPTIVNEILSLYAVAVALFMAISGFLLFNKIENIKDTQERWICVKHQVIRILRIYLLWSIPYIIYTIWKWDWSAITFKFVFWQIQGWFFKSTFFTIWFMPALAMGLVLTFWLTEKISGKIVNLLAVMMYILGSLMLTYSFLGDKIPGFSFWADFTELWLGGPRGWLFFAFPLIMVGKKMVEMKEKMKCGLMMMLSCICVLGMLMEALILRKYIGHTGIDMTIMMIPSVFCILGFLISLDFPAGVYSIWMRKMSVLIFMTQRLFLTVLPDVFPEFFNMSDSWNFLTICGGTVLFSMFIYRVSKYFKICSYLC